MDILEPDDKLYNKCFAALRRLCAEVGNLPSRLVLPVDQLKRQSTHPLSSCGYADIWRGSLAERNVALKAFRIFGENNLPTVRKVNRSKLFECMSCSELTSQTQLFCKEAVLWRRLKHPNVVPFLGVNSTLFELCIVSEWMPHGDINTYLRADPATNRLALVSLQEINISDLY